MATPTRAETAEYVTAVRQLTQDITEVYFSIMSEPANGIQKISELDDKMHEFQNRFRVMLKVIVGDPLTPFKSFSMEFHCRASMSGLSLEKFMQLPQISITSLLGDDKPAPKCSICLTPFSEHMAQASLTNTNEENQPRSTELPAEIANSGDIPVRLPCGHIFGMKCIYSWITRNKDETPWMARNPATCPLCRARIECVENVEVIEVPCPEMLDSEENGLLNLDSEENRLLNLFMALTTPWQGRVG